MLKTITSIFLVTVLLACNFDVNQENQTKVKLENIEVRKLDSNHWQTYTDIVIDAPIEKVWSVLTDWNNISSWSSSLISITGDIRNNGEVNVSYLVDGKTYSTPHEFIYEELKEFGWSDEMEGTFQGLQDNHRFRVEKISDSKTLFIQVDDFKGVGNKELSAEQVAKITVKFFPLFNRELKIQAEKENAK